MILWKGHCSVHGRFSPDVVDELRADDPRRADPGAPGVPPRGRHQGRPGRLDRVHHQDHRGRAGRLVLGDRHRAQPGQAARRRAPRPAHRLPGPHRLLLLDDEPDRPAAPGLGAGVARRGPAGQRDRGRPGDRALGQGRAPADARPARASHTATERLARAAGQLEPERRAATAGVVDARSRRRGPATIGGRWPGRSRVRRRRSSGRHPRTISPKIDSRSLLGYAGPVVGDADPHPVPRLLAATRITGSSTWPAYFTALATRFWSDRPHLDVVASARAGRSSTSTIVRPVSAPARSARTSATIPFRSSRRHGREPCRRARRSPSVPMIVARIRCAPDSASRRTSSRCSGSARRPRRAPRRASGAPSPPMASGPWRSWLTWPANAASCSLDAAQLALTGRPASASDSWSSSSAAVRAPAPRPAALAELESTGSCARRPSLARGRRCTGCRSGRPPW